jgi:hypothetical protein
MVAAMTTTALAVAGPAQAKTKTYKFKNLVVTTKQVTPTTVAGTTKGGPFGKGKATGIAAIPKYTITLKVKGGTAVMVVVAHIVGVKAIGTWKWTKGTGKFKGIKGKGKTVGTAVGANFDTFEFACTGKATY